MAKKNQYQAEFLSLNNFSNFLFSVRFIVQHRQKQKEKQKRKKIKTTTVISSVTRPEEKAAVLVLPIW